MKIRQQNIKDLVNLLRKRCRKIKGGKLWYRRRSILAVGNQAEFMQQPRDPALLTQQENLPGI